MADMEELLLLLSASTQRRLACVLFFVFVWRSEADCPVPKKKDFALSPKSWLDDAFPEGSIAFMTCHRGYEADGGSDMITCRNGNWTELTLRCKRKDCGPLEPQPNMRFNTTSNTLYGDVVKVTCNEGYMIEGSSYRICMVSGWMFPSSCQIVTCQKPAEVTNGKSLWDSQDFPKYGEVIQYECDEGYTLVGNKSIVCKNLEYDSPPPVCKEIFAEKNVEAADDNKDANYLPTIISVICVTLGVGIAAVCLHRHLKNKGSYDTREGPKHQLVNV
ncbi:zona pellucida sperm-binding protein 3 receptor isoform X2 [Dunckerocampus dactyliophorus]|uniref:zona pellucida sperm-binding protein 3 receptor isoform X2 n=1 Tax=Dunckerocampus dactyliophorus TaxID=161453 RepID=UPI002405FB2D|nr:zona pellucida sperm-binding protein 3 receptor isoform X2 [Dunckerocampus dactyliophorus]